MRDRQKHKKIRGLLVLLLFAVLLSGLPVSATSVPVVRNGKSTKLNGTIISVKCGGKRVLKSSSGTPAVKIGSVIYVPCKTLFSDKGIHASYEKKGKKVILCYGERKVVFYAGKKYAVVNGKKMRLSAKPYFITYKKSKVRDLLVPARQAAAFFGMKYYYSASKRTVTLRKRKGIQKSATQADDIKKSAFIETVGPMAKANYERTGILASVTLAQAILESDWGQSTLAENANNLFGMKKNLSRNTWSNSSWDGLSYYSKYTYEYTKTSRYRIRAQFRKYSCIEDSIEDHSAYLLGAKKGSRKRYAGLTNAKSYKKQLKIIKKGGYATSGSYVNDLCKIIRAYHLTKWDKK